MTGTWGSNPKERSCVMQELVAFTPPTHVELPNTAWFKDGGDTGVKVVAETKDGPDVRAYKPQKTYITKAASNSWYWYTEHEWKTRYNSQDRHGMPFFVGTSGMVLWKR